MIRIIHYVLTMGSLDCMVRSKASSGAHRSTATVLLPGRLGPETRAAVGLVAEISARAMPAASGHKDMVQTREAV